MRKFDRKQIKEELREIMTKDTVFVCVGTDKGSKIEKMWEDCVRQAQTEYLTKRINKGRLHTNYIQANTMQEAWWQVCQVLLGKGTFSANN